MRTVLPRRLIVLLAALALFVGFASAQSSRWYDPYQRGLRAFEAGRYQESVKQLEQAVAADPRAGANKYVEGVFRSNYFPYYYLGLSYLKLGELDKAQQNLLKAKPGLPQALASRLNDAERELEAALASVRREAPVEKPVVAPPARNPKFDAGLQQAESSLRAGQYDAALKQFDALKALDTAEYGKGNLEARRNEAARGAATQLVDEGRRLLQNSQLNAAKAKFLEASQTFAGMKTATDGLDEIGRREDAYRRHKTAAEQAALNRNVTAARDEFEQARTANPEQFATDNLAAQLALVVSSPATIEKPTAPAGTDPRLPNDEAQRLFDRGRLLANQGKYAEAESSYAAAVRADPRNRDAATALEKSRRFMRLRTESAELNKRGDATAAQRRLTEARQLDPVRFEGEGLIAVLNSLSVPAKDDSLHMPLRQALLALLEGSPQNAISILEPTLSQRQPRGNQALAPLYAYLGVAYATRALSSPKPEDQNQLRGKAIEQFRLTLEAQADYQLSSRLVSPRIIAMFEQARVQP